MRLLLTAALSASAIFRCLSGPIDFTPEQGQRQLEGIAFSQLLFRQDGHVISYEPPREWICTGDSSRLTLAPSKTSQAKATIEQVSLPAPQAFDQAAVNQFQQLVIRSLPADAEQVQVLSQEANPVRINQQDSYEITASYNYFGQEYEISVIFANLGNLQLRLRFVARKADFDALHRAFRGSLFTLHWS